MNLPLAYAIVWHIYKFFNVGFDVGKLADEGDFIEEATSSGLIFAFIINVLFLISGYFLHLYLYTILWAIIFAIGFGICIAIKEIKVTSKTVVFQLTLHSISLAYILYKFIL